MHILIVGGGNMGLAYAKLLFRTKAMDVHDLVIIEKHPERCHELEGLHIGTVMSKLEVSCMSKANVVLLAVKPQDAAPVFEELSPYIQSKHLVLSIMAGVSISTIVENLSATQVVRAMPNLPLVASEGVTVYTTSEQVNKKSLVLIEHLMTLSGQSIRVDDERLLDAATAISGSGPGYVFYIIQSFIDKAVALGFRAAEAELLVSQTFLGSLKLLHDTSPDCEGWIKRVSSKGGTTEAGLSSFEESRLRDTLHKGIEASYQRAKALANINF